MNNLILYTVLVASIFFLSIANAQLHKLAFNTEVKSYNIEGETKDLRCVNKLSDSDIILAQIAMVSVWFMLFKNTLGGFAMINNLPKS